MRRLMYCVLLLLISVPLLGQKAPWLWTTEERAKARLDPVQRSARIREYNERLAARGMPTVESSASPNSGDVIDGNVHPELFFATELFESLVRSSFVTLPRIYPRVVRERTSDLFKDTSEWEEFAGIVTDYAVLLANEKYLNEVISVAASGERAEIEQQLADVRGRKCPEMARAMRDSREAFGRLRFDRMLYEVVPPGSGRTYSGSHPPSVGVDVWREEHCQ